MASLIQCCLCVVLAFILVLLVLFLLATGGYIYKAGIYVHNHGGHVELKSALSFAEQNIEYDGKLSVIVAAVVVGVLVAIGVFVCMCLALIEIKTMECLRCMCGCGRNSRPRFYTTPEDQA